MKYSRKSHKKSHAKNIDDVLNEISVTHYEGDSPDVFELINMYGTYEVQKTPDTENAFTTGVYKNSSLKKDNKDS